MLWQIKATVGRIAGLIAGMGPDWVPAGHPSCCYFQTREEAAEYKALYTWEDGLRVVCVQS